MEIEIERPNFAKYQTDILYCSARFTITEASTKIGKTFSHIFWLYEISHGYENGVCVDSDVEGKNYWWVAPSHGQAKIAFKRLKKTLRQVPGYLFNNSLKTIETPLGSVIHFKTSADDDALYGEDVYGCVLDEAPRAKYDAFVAIRSTLTFTKGKCKLIGNFGGISNWMHQLKEKAVSDPENYAYFKVTAWDAVDAGILSRAEIEQAQRDLPPKIFKQLYLAEEQESEDMLCTYDSIQDLWTNTHVTGNEMFITADIALQGSDNFVVFVWRGFTIVHAEIVPKIEADEVEKMLKNLADEWNVGRSNIVYDADGLGSFLRGYLKGAKPFNNGAAPFAVKGKKPNYKNLKSQCGYEFAKMVNSKEVFINCEVDKSKIIAELECLQSYALDQDGKIQLLPKAKIKEIIGHSPDLLDALIMRMYFVLVPKFSKPKAKYL